MKYKYCFILLLMSFFAGSVYAQRPRLQGDLKELFAGPSNPSDHDAWLFKMKRWRTAEKDKLDYNADEYSRPQLSWLKKTFIYVQMMACDRYFYDPVSGKYTVDRYLNDLKKQYGGIDAVLIWPTYPNMGIDYRNQFDILAAMPGGIKGVKKMVSDFHKDGVRVFFPIMIWDRGTRKIVLTMAVSLIKEMKEIGADGMNGDTMWGVTEAFLHAYDSLRYPVTIYREFPDAWGSSEWEPFVPTRQKGVFASKFPEGNKTVYTFVNRDSTDKQGREIQLPYQTGTSYYDIWNGMKLTPEKEGNKIYLRFPIEGHGFGAVLKIKPRVVDHDFSRFLNRMHALSERRLKDYSAAWKPLPQKIVAIKKTNPATKAPKGMVLIPAVKNYIFESEGVFIEGDPLPDAEGIQYPWEKHPARATKHALDIPSFYIDEYPVTNEQFKKFMDATHYHPEDDYNFLKDWESGTYPRGWGNEPVTWVSLEDARAYAKWAGKRLPHEWEWQYAAQGTDGRAYPWGNKMDPAKMPPPDSSRNMRPPTDVNAYPQGASPFGVVDMVGNVWQWTDEYRDEHTRAAILKGGGYYRADGSQWYFPRAYKVNEYGKYLLRAPCIDRSASIGFRCVKDK